MISDTEMATQEISLHHPLIGQARAACTKNARLTIRLCSRLPKNHRLLCQARLDTQYAHPQTQMCHRHHGAASTQGSVSGKYLNPRRATPNFFVVPMRTHFSPILRLPLSNTSIYTIFECIKSRFESSGSTAVQGDSRAVWRSRFDLRFQLQPSCDSFVHIAHSKRDLYSSVGGLSLL
jgi:hypothetical protein